MLESGALDYCSDYRVIVAYCLIWCSAVWMGEMIRCDVLSATINRYTRLDPFKYTHSKQTKQLQSLTHYAWLLFPLFGWLFLLIIFLSSNIMSTIVSDELKRTKWQPKRESSVTHQRRRKNMSNHFWKPWLLKSEYRMMMIIMLSVEWIISILLFNIINIIPDFFCCFSSGLELSLSSTAHYNSSFLLLFSPFDRLIHMRWCSPLFHQIPTVSLSLLNYCHKCWIGFNLFSLYTLLFPTD